MLCELFTCACAVCTAIYEGTEKKCDDGAVATVLQPTISLLFDWMYEKRFTNLV